MNRRRHTLFAAGVLSLLSLPIIGSASQPGDRPPPPADERTERPPRQPGNDRLSDRPGRVLPMSREAMRQRLTERLTEMQAVEDRLRETLAMIDDRTLSDAELSVRLEELRPFLRQVSERFPALSRVARNRADRAAAQDPDGERAKEPPPNDAGPMTPEQTERAVAWLERHMPRLAARLLALREENPEAFARLLARMKPRMVEMERTLKENPALFELRLDEWRSSLEVIEASRTLRERVASGADQPSVDDARAALRAALGEQFDAQLRLQENELASLRQRFESLDAKINDRRGRRDEWITRRERELGGTDDEQPPRRGRDEPGEPRPRRGDAPPR